MIEGTTITQKEIDKFWTRWDLIILSWFFLSAFTVLTVLSPVIAWIVGNWYIALFFLFMPSALVLKYVFGVKGIWILNDTKDGDSGNEDIFKRYGFENKPKIFKYVWWWFRNHSWNYISKFKPQWMNGAVDKNEFGKDEFLVIENTLNKETEAYGRWTRAEKDAGIYGTKYIAYRINGIVECQYSFANENRQKKFGGGGTRYKCHLRF